MFSFIPMKKSESESTQKTPHRSAMRAILFKKTPLLKKNDHLKEA